MKHEKLSRVRGHGDLKKFENYKFAKTSRESEMTLEETKYEIEREKETAVIEKDRGEREKERRR